MPVLSGSRVWQGCPAKEFPTSRFLRRFDHRLSLAPSWSESLNSSGTALDTSPQALRLPLDATMRYLTLNNVGVLIAGPV